MEVLTSMMVDGQSNNDVYIWIQIPFKPVVQDAQMNVTDMHRLFVDAK